MPAVVYVESALIMSSHFLLLVDCGLGFFICFDGNFIGVMATLIAGAICGAGYSHFLQPHDNTTTVIHIFTDLSMCSHSSESLFQNAVVSCPMADHLGWQSSSKLCTWSLE